LLFQSSPILITPRRLFADLQYQHALLLLIRSLTVLLTFFEIGQVA
jgi:hypothetical protein